MVIHRILAALDESPRAPAVLDAALSLARLSGARVLVYRALAIPPEFPPAAKTSGGDPLASYLRHQAVAALETLLLAAPDVPHEIVVDESPRPARAILHAAEAHRADLIVIGSHGYDALDRLLGTTAARVVNLATCNVLVVHRPVDADDAARAD